MRRLVPRDAAIGGALAIVPVLLVLGFLGWNREGHTAGDTSVRGTDGASVRAGSSFTINGDITRAIIPGGEMRPLDLSLENPNDVELSIDRITVSVHAVDAPRADADHPCSAADFEVRQAPGGVVLRLDANGAQTLSEMDLAPGRRPALGMLNRSVNQDGCKGAFLTLGYRASGVEVHP